MELESQVEELAARESAPATGPPRPLEERAKSFGIGLKSFQRRRASQGGAAHELPSDSELQPGQRSASESLKPQHSLTRVLTRTLTRSHTRRSSNHEQHDEEHAGSSSHDHRGHGVALGRKATLSRTETHRAAPKLQAHAASANLNTARTSFKLKKVTASPNRGGLPEVGARAAKTRGGA